MFNNIKKNDRYSDFLLNFAVLQKSDIYIKLITNSYSIHMKKLYAIAAACVVAASASAQLYVTGPGESFPGHAWDASNPLEVAADANGNYTFTASNLNEFKMSTAKGSWDAFNGGALWCEIKADNLGQTINLVNGDGNVRTPWPGEYTVSVSADYKTAVVTTTTPKPIEKIDIYVRGDMNGWGAPADWKFETEDYVNYSLTCKISAGQQFKIADANWSRANYGGQADYGTYDWWLNGSNASFQNDFDGTISFTFDAGQNPLAITFTEAPLVEPGVSYTVWGNLDGSVYDSAYEMTRLESGVWTLGQFTTEGGAFKIRRYADGKLDSTLGRTDDEPLTPEMGSTYDVTSTAAQAWYLPRGIYTITYSPKHQTLVVNGNVYPESYEIPAECYIIGNVDGASWATDKGVEGVAEGSVFTFTDVEIDPSGEGAEWGYFSFVPMLGESWEAVNANDRYGAAYGDAEVSLKEANQVYIYRANNGSSNNCAAWKIKPGVYNFSLDLEAMTLDVKDAAGIADITEGTTAAPVYYNLQGVRVANPANGLFIEVRGTSTRKVLVK